MKNKLFNTEGMPAFQIAQAHYEHRRTGRTTAIALELIAKCIAQPNVPHSVSDHFGTPAANRYLAAMIGDLVIKLDLQFFNVKHGPDRITVQCDIWGQEGK